MAEQDEYWRNNFTSRPYVAAGASYDDYSVAYRFGYERCPEYHGRQFEEVEHEFSRDWGTARGGSQLSWDEARHATRDAYERARDAVERPGNSPKD